MDNRSEAGAEVVDDNVEVAFVVGYDPGFYTGIPNGIIKSQHKLDIGVVLGHAENKAAGCYFEGDGVAAYGDGKEIWIRWFGEHI